jgi:hypothetical protein
MDDGSNGREVKVKITMSHDVLAFRPDGYGDCMERAGGIPLLLEVNEGELRVVVWEDINADDPGHIVSLEGAREELRKPANDQSGV